MPKSIIVEGKTTAEALEKGLKELNVSKNMVEVKQIEEKEKRSFYSILSPRVVKLEITVKEGIEELKKEIIKKRNLMENQEDLERVKGKVQAFLDKFLPNEVNYNISIEEATININIDGEKINYLIGYRGETINAIQTLLSAIANRKEQSKVRVIVDIAGYKEKRKRTLEELAEKVAKTVIKTKKSITLEPMTAYERKIIHTKLQENDKVETYSKGEEPYRRLVVSLKK